MCPSHRQIDLERHNEEVRRIWEAYDRSVPLRVPMLLHTDTHYFLFNEELNPGSEVTFHGYLNDPDVMFERQVMHQWWAGQNLPQDREMGLPEGGWSVRVDLQNCGEAEWFGCPVEYRSYDKHGVPDVPYAVPWLKDENKEEIFERGMPDPFGGRHFEYYRYFQEKARDHAFQGLPVVEVAPYGFMVSTQGLFTVASQLRGMREICLDMKLDPDYYHRLMDFVTEAKIRAVKAWRDHLGQPPLQRLHLVDDSVVMLSADSYRELVLPYHRQYVGALGDGGPHSFYTCGDDFRFLRIFRDELNCSSFDMSTAAPNMDPGKVREVLGPEVEIRAGIEPAILKEGPEDAIVSRVRSVLASGIMEGGKFIFLDAGNVPPHTPLAHLGAMYEAVKTHGKYQRSSA